MFIVPHPKLKEFILWVTRQIEYVGFSDKQKNVATDLMRREFIHIHWYAPAKPVPYCSDRPEFAVLRSRCASEIVYVIDNFPQAAMRGGSVWTESL